VRHSASLRCGGMVAPNRSVARRKFSEKFLLAFLSPMRSSPALLARQNPPRCAARLRCATRLFGPKQVWARVWGFINRDRAKLLSRDLQEPKIRPQGSSTFEQVAHRLHLTPSQYATSAELKEWVR
jgi:hypothetical protein